MSRRGVAMLLVLVVLVVAVSAAVNVARVSVTGMAAESINRDRILADDLLVQAEEAARHWLIDHSASVVLLPDTDRPSIVILHDSIRLGKFSCRLSITAVDLMGMPPISSLKNSGLGSAIPDSAIDAIVNLKPKGRSLGPDQIDRAAIDIPIYPRSLSTVLGIFGDPQIQSPDVDGSMDTDSGPPSICETVSFIAPSTLQQPDRAEARSTQISLNVNTAPIPLLEAAFAGTGLDALGPIIEARQGGNPAALNLTLDDNDPIRFVTRSTLWGIRSDVDTGSVRGSWWTVFEQQGGDWRIVRRIVIND